jgi:hypothetical protein
MSAKRSNVCFLKTENVKNIVEDKMQTLCMIVIFGNNAMQYNVSEDEIK